MSVIAVVGEFSATVDGSFSEWTDLEPSLDDGFDASELEADDAEWDDDDDDDDDDEDDDDWDWDDDEDD